MFNSSNYYRNPHTNDNPIVEAIEQLREDVDRIDGALTDETANRIDDDIALNDRIDALPANDHEIAGSRYLGWYHVDNMTGNDENDGSTWDKSFKTLKACFDYANAHGSHDLRIALVESTVPYEYPYAAIATGCLHISGFSRITHTAYAEPIGQGDSAPVTINCTNTDRPLALYCTHLNMQGINFYHAALTNEDYTAEIYLDGGFLLARYCKFNCRYSQNAGTFWTAGCYFNQLRLNYCNARFYGQTVFSADALSVASTGIRLDVRGSHVTFDSSYDYSITFLGGLARLFRLVDSYVSFGGRTNYTFTEPTTEIPWSIDNCIIFASSTFFNDLTTMSDYAFTDSCVLRGLSTIQSSNVVNSNINNNTFITGG